MRVFKVTIAIFFCLYLFSCTQSNDTNIKDMCEAYAKNDVVKELKYPESYKAISTTIIDTIMEVQNLEDDMNLFYSESSIEHSKEMVEKYMRLWESAPSCAVCSDKINEFNIELAKLQNGRDSITKIIQTIDRKLVSYITIEHKYSAKNNFGSLIIGKLILKYFPNQNDKSKRIFIYSKD